MTTGTSAGGVLRSVAHLSVGTLVAQGLTVVSQLVLAVWLTPEDFGLWATASSSVVVLTGLINFGEVNSYLTTAGASFHESRRAVWRMNSPLVICGLIIAVVYLKAARTDVALLILLATINLPLLGDSNLLYAVFIKRGRNAQLVSAQVLSALARTLVGIVVAWVTGSAVALAASTLCYSVIMTFALTVRTRAWPGYELDGASGLPWRRRLMRSIHALFQLLPTQIDFLVVSLVGSPRLLGIYFVSYQVTVGLAGLVGLPLNRSVLAAFSEAQSEQRSALAARLISVVSGAIGVVTCLAATAVLLAGGLLPTGWLEAGPTICLLLASLPPRFVASLADSLLVADGRWWGSVRLNAIDTVGIGVVSVSAMTGNITALATFVVAWAVVFTMIRIRLTLASLGGRECILIVVPSTLTATSLSVGVLIGRPYVWPLVAVATASSGLPTLWRLVVAAGRQPIAGQVRS